MNYRVLIADDDPGIRLIIKKIMEKVEGFILEGEAEDGYSAFSLAQSLRPDVIFMDVEMPNLTGIECAKKILDINPKTIIIFATAHGEYMPDAFELYAFDYLIKPFKMERIKNTLERIKSLSIQIEDKTIKPVKNFKNSTSLDKLIIKNKEGINFIDIKDIILIQREERSTVVYTNSERYVTSEGLNELENRLDSSVFMRSHKSYIINIMTIHKIYPYGRWTYIVKFRETDKDALITHEHYEELQKLFEK